MSTNNPEFPILDDERFDNLIEDFETFFSAFIEEISQDAEDEEGIEEVEQLLEEHIGLVSILLAGLHGEMLSATTDESGNNVYELRLTMPSGDLSDRIRRLMAELDIDDLD